MSDYRNGAGYSNTRRSYSSNDGRRKKSRLKDRRITMTKEEKAQYLYNHLQRTGLPVLQQYTVPTLCDLFANGLHQPELSSAWSVCLEEIRASYDAKDNRPSQTPHGPGYPQSDLPPDGVTILQRPQHNARREENEVCETQEAIDAAKRELESATWEDFKSGQLGHFFMNKVYFDEENQRSWQAPHDEDSVTKVTTLEDLVPSNGLRKMLAVNDRWFGDMQEYLGIFPQDVQITAVCPMKRPQDMPVVTKKTLICPEHHGVEYAAVDPHHELLDVTCGCPKARLVDIMHPRKNMNLSCTLLILHYDDHMRFIQTSASLNRRSWERVAQFGWYRDFPYYLSWAEDSPTEQTTFSFVLSHLLTTLGCDSGAWLERVDFSGLPPFIQLIANTPGVVNLSPNNLYKYGAIQLREMTADARKILKTQTTEKFYQFKRFGKRGLEALRKVFDEDKHSSKKTDAKLIYPSADIAATILESDPVELRPGLMSMMYEYKCRFMDEWRLLHNIDDPRVFPHANVLSEYTVVEGAGGESRWFGWLCTGSHCLSNGAWGGQNNVRINEIFYARYELSVVLCPFYDNGTLRAVDLSKIGKHFHAPVPYGPEQSPFYPETNSIHDKVRHCIGQLKRMHGKSFGYVNQPRADNPLASHFDPFPPPQTYSRRTVNAMLNAAVTKRDGFSDLPPDGTVIEFIGYEWKDMAGGNVDWKFRTGRIIRTYSSWQEACEACGVTFVPPKEPVPELGSLFAPQEGSSTRGTPRGVAKRKLTPEEAMKYLKIETEEDFETHWQRKWRSWWTMDPFHHRSLDVDLERDIPMEPMRLPPDMTWLEKHVRQTCEDSIPPLRGPYRIDLLQAEVDAHWRKHFKGLPKRDSAYQAKMAATAI